MDAKELLIAVRSVKYALDKIPADETYPWAEYTANKFLTDNRATVLELMEDALLAALDVPEEEMPRRWYKPTSGNLDISSMELQNRLAQMPVEQRTFSNVVDVITEMASKTWASKPDDIYTRIARLEHAVFNRGGGDA